MSGTVAAVGMGGRRAGTRRTGTTSTATAAGSARLGRRARVALTAACGIALLAGPGVTSVRSALDAAREDAPRHSRTTTDEVPAAYGRTAR